MIPHYLKASDEAALWNALETAKLASKQYDPADPLNKPPKDLTTDWQPTGKFTWAKADGYDLDIIGEIYKPTGETETVDGFEVPVMEKLDGYHANIRKWDGDFLPAQIQVLPTISAPANPVRIWAGD